MESTKAAVVVLAWNYYKRGREGMSFVKRAKIIGIGTLVELERSFAVGEMIIIVTIATSCLWE